MRISDWSSDVCSSDLRVSLSLADPALVEDDQADSDAGTMLRIGAAENRDLDARAGNFRDGDIAARTARIVRDGRRPARDAASALGQRPQRAAKRSEERRVGKEWVATGSSRWDPQAN